MYWPAERWVTAALGSPLPGEGGRLVRRGGAEAHRTARARATPSSACSVTRIETFPGMSRLSTRCSVARVPGPHDVDHRRQP